MEMRVKDIIFVKRIIDKRLFMSIPLENNKKYLEHGYLHLIYLGFNLPNFLFF